MRLQLVEGVLLGDDMPRELHLRLTARIVPIATEVQEVDTQEAVVVVEAVAETTV
jgi:hypothetical protein